MDNQLIESVFDQYLSSQAQPCNRSHCERDFVDSQAQPNREEVAGENGQKTADGAPGFRVADRDGRAGWETEIGSIEVGKLADLLVHDDSPFFF